MLKSYKRINISIEQIKSNFDVKLKPMNEFTRYVLPTRNEKIINDS